MYQLGIGGIKKLRIQWLWATGQFFRLSEIFLLSVRTDSMNENSVIMIQSIFPS